MGKLKAMRLYRITLRIIAENGNLERNFHNAQIWQMFRVCMRGAGSPDKCDRCAFYDTIHSTLK